MTTRALLLALCCLLRSAVAAGEVPREVPAMTPTPAAATTDSPAATPAPGAEAAPATPSVADVASPLLSEPELPKSELPPGLEDGEELNLGWTLVRTMVVLGMVIALVYLTLNVGLRKLLGIRPTVGTSVVTVLERVPLDQRRSLFVVEAAGEVLLIGGSDSSLALLSKLDRAEVERIRAAKASGQPVQLSPFLQKLLGRKDAPPPPAS
jgi:flagellar biogenesis protein FliO